MLLSVLVALATVMVTAWLVGALFKRLGLVVTAAL